MAGQLEGHPQKGACLVGRSLRLDKPTVRSVFCIRLSRQKLRLFNSVRFAPGQPGGQPKTITTPATYPKPKHTPYTLNKQTAKTMYEVAPCPEFHQPYKASPQRELALPLQTSKILFINHINFPRACRTRSSYLIRNQQDLGCLKCSTTTTVHHRSQSSWIAFRIIRFRRP